MGLFEEGWNAPAMKPPLPGLYKRLVRTEKGGVEVEIGFWDGWRWYSMNDGLRLQQDCPWRSIAGHGARCRLPTPPGRM